MLKKRLWPGFCRHPYSGNLQADCLFVTAGLPVEGPRIPPERYLESMQLDKKVKDGAIRFILLDRIGKASLDNSVPAPLLLETLSTCIADG